MPKQAETKSKSTAGIPLMTDGANFDIEQATATGQKSIAAFAHLHSRVFRDAMKFNAELLDFARRRIGAEIETSDRLSRCESMTDAVEVMTKFCQCAFEDYAQQTTSLVRIGTEISTRNVEETAAEATKLNGN